MANFILCIYYIIQKNKFKKKRERLAEMEKCYVSSPWCPVKISEKETWCLDSQAACGKTMRGGAEDFCQQLTPACSPNE